MRFSDSGVFPSLYKTMNLLFTGHSGHAGVHEQLAKCTPPEGHPHYTSNLGSWRLYPFAPHLCGKEEYTRPLW